MRRDTVDNPAAAAEGCDAVGEDQTSRLDRLPELCAADGEFRLLARHWTGVLRLGVGDRHLDLRVRDGAPGEIVDAPAEPLPDQPGSIGLAASVELWNRILAAVPEPFCNDVVPAQAFGLVRSGSELTFWQYYPAVRRVVELLRSGAVVAGGV